MNKYIYSVCSNDDWPTIESVTASNISDAEDKIICKYCEIFEFDNNDLLDYREFQELMNDHDIVISDLYDIEEFYEKT